MNQPIVGITAWRRHLDTFLGREQLQTLSTYYTDAIIAAEMTPIMFPNGQDPEQAGRLVDMVDGLILSGGDDVAPSSYGAASEHDTGADVAVDAFEIALVQTARERGKPVLAICRGLQLLNVALGGTLKQEVTGTSPAHEVIDTDTDPEELNNRRHIVTFEEDSVLAGAYGSSELKVNTLHHQGVSQLAGELIVEGKTEDGLIEAARCDGSWWALGVQWHPERLDLSHQTPLFTAFRDALSGAA